MVFDPPEWHMAAYHMAPATIRYVKKIFNRTVASSACCAVISQPMADEYQNLYGVATQVIQHSLPESIGQPLQGTLSDEEHLFIGMAGQLYAKEAWESLLDMLAAHNWTIAGRKVVIRYMGRGPLSPSNGPQHIEWLGWRDQRDAVRLLAECDVLYCPYPFKDEEKDVARLSFPSKITLYLAAARPILFHGPSYASPVEFFLRTKCGFSCMKVGGEELQKKLEMLIREPELYASMCQNAYTVFRNEFTSNAMRKSIFRFLALDAQ
jgi:glycosyltransferase involved in cell wall biosynthesis